MAFYGKNEWGVKEATVAIVSVDGQYPKGYVQIGSQLYKVTASAGNKETANGNEVLFWVTISKARPKPGTKKKTPKKSNRKNDRL